MEREPEFIGRAPALLDKLRLADRIAPTDASVCIVGEMGVGKALLAKRIHDASRRAQGPFVRVQCANRPETVVAHELFGSTSHTGCIERAAGGTLFLDEVGALPLRLQAALLRLLQHKVFEKIDSTALIPADVRLIAATSCDIDDMVDREAFRADLYYRLNAMPLYMPPLRERPKDIPLLADYFMRHYRAVTNKHITGFRDTAYARMKNYAWPGNVRELKNAVERAVLLSRGTEIGAADLILGLASVDSEDYTGLSLKDGIIVFKRAFLRKALESNRWNQTKTARILDIQRTYLSRLVKELQIVHSKE